MNFASRITRLPHAFDPDHGQDALSATPWATGDVAKLIAGTGGCSPYLKSLIEKEQAWLAPALDAPEQALQDIYSALRDTAPDVLPSELRRAKRRVALMTGLADLAGVWPLETVTQALSDFADLAVHLALRATVGAEIKRGKLPGQTPDDAEQAGGMVALAMGKMGAGELNYSSDVDLICLFDETRFEPDDYHDARASFVRATRKMCGMLSDLTGEGYVFRTDLRLRPDPSVTPVCIAMETAERYYESVGRTWERAAYIKARPAAGDLAAGEAFLKTLKPFVWRKHLDFAAIQDAHDMVERIREHKGLGGPITLPSHNMKLGRGGIREIEFFTQTRQIIAGGRDPDLRVRGTVPGLSVLAQKGWVPEDVADTLTQHYRSHREVEHRVQMIRDAQTHDLPQSDEGFDRLAAFMGTDRASLQSDLQARLEEVHTLTEGFFGGETSTEAPGDIPEDLATSETVSRWRTYPALRSARGSGIFQRLRPEILRRLAKTSNPQDALAAFDGFLSGLPAGVQVFSLFEANPHLIDLLIDIVGVSPDLARYLSRNASVFDAVIGGDFFSDWPGQEALLATLQDVLSQEADYENKLNTGRRWGKEWHFRIGVHLLRGLIDAEEAGRQYADLADATLGALSPVVHEEFARKHGPAPGRGAVVLGMGSLGSRRLHARSDLDLIVIYDPADVDMSDGRRPLASRPYYARLTQALITAMTVPMAEGRLYEVDMRLRPSGNQGPVATSLTSYRDYQISDAWVWEHLALTRARVVAGPKALATDVQAVQTEVMTASRDVDTILREVAIMRQRIASAKGTGNPWDAKLGQGRMQDIELMAQAAALLAGRTLGTIPDALQAGAECGVLTKADADTLCDVYRLCWSLQIGARLISETTMEPDKNNGSGAEFLCRITGTTDVADLQDRLDRDTRRAADIINAVLPDVEEEE
ncbi:bifunctional [glutamine synthetase] adenylyltransferase/[glutamine synthetase]-adenylyl-L-tyrosine phosphorylase [Marivita sp. S6314]|uniref:bifunctional [glutamine synthetase] adenylyltransferase/[glutamine synthetase]-adenylyl-L-tyrosine phosphorylase n=1 Tax=Marivita sp. S6314 TaxID=2926406 RepID=UPI001FF3724A|nr:bifunctional [glutamine synthetase] adenylyltransferase/[glutamine synthetase]-adenylyl-L-tyrosine phosphorylase [Marivita sp. S6314]MCK0148931.1 bifunctional [glutamine synthetase] adenylyltransferase/[glutamine synthetase]-adenylyl-L-tyrosine phosphorylase [Marivita sp. S6314]